jgi:putative ABC transport system permease protein
MSEPAAAGYSVYSVGAGEQSCKVLGIALLRGRDFEVGDRTRQPVPALVNQSLARQLFGDADPVGSQLLEGDRVLEIVGVTADTRMRTLGEERAPMLFTPYTDMQMIVRSRGIHHNG